jgi:hypothetical protein
VNQPTNCIAKKPYVQQLIGIETQKEVNFFERKREKIVAYLLSKSLALISSSISSFEGGSATLGTDFATPLGTHETAAIIIPLQSSNCFSFSYQHTTE